ncbi:MAG: galactokinase family protein [Ilumatobacteraceae bacterium]
MADTRRVHAPGRVNLIGDHTDYTGGLVFPMAIDRGTTIEYAPQAERIELRSDADPAAVVVDLPVLLDPSLMEPAWGAYVAAMARELGSTRGVVGTVTSDIPAGAGLSSSAALECAVGLALGFDGTPIELALAAQRAEHDATGVPTGIMDQLCIAAATAGHATMIDCHHLDVIQVPIPDDVDVDAARAQLDEVSFRRARHVVTENQRVRDFAAALVSGDHAEAGALMTESHRSLRDDFDTSTPEMDAAVERLAGSPGVYGARMTGGGFGGCVVVLSEPGALTTGWHVRPSPGARHL